MKAGAVGDRGPRGPPGPPGSPGQNATESGTGSAVYTRWGRDECPSSATLVYAGKCSHTIVLEGDKNRDFFHNKVIDNEYEIL